MRTRYLFHTGLVAVAALVTLTPPATHASPPAADTWTMAGAMHQAHVYHTATLLPSGLVLVAGGCTVSCVATASAELYHPHTGSWASTSAMHVPRLQFTATLLRDGQVLAAGGISTDGNPLTGAELYNPRTSVWTITGSMHESRSLQTATLLPDGRVLVTGGAGGSNASPLAEAELYDPRAGTWTLTGAMHQARARQTATLLPDGKVLVAGGAAGGSNYANANPLASAELYNPRTGVWTMTGAMHDPRFSHSATLLRNGLVLVAGGYDAGGDALQAELYDPHTGSWTRTGSLHHAINFQTGEGAARLSSGLVLVAGNATNLSNPSLAGAELYNPRTGAWTLTGSLHEPRDGQAETLLSTGQVLVAGGWFASPLASAEVYQP